MAHKKAGGSTALGRDSQAQRLGIKLFGGQNAKPGDIIVRQRGTKYHAGLNVRRGKDDSLYSTAAGLVHFLEKKVKRFSGRLDKRMFVNVLPKK